MVFGLLLPGSRVIITYSLIELELMPVSQRLPSWLKELLPDPTLVPISYPGTVGSSVWGSFFNWPLPSMDLRKVNNKNCIFQGVIIKHTFDMAIN